MNWSDPLRMSVNWHLLARITSTLKMLFGHSRAPVAPWLCHSTGLCSHPGRHIFRLPPGEPRKWSPGCWPALSPGLCNSPRSGRSRTAACQISWTSRMALPVRWNSGRGMSLCSTWHLLPTDKADLRGCLMCEIGFWAAQAQTHTGSASKACVKPLCLCVCLPAVPVLWCEVGWVQSEAWP